MAFKLNDLVGSPLVSYLSHGTLQGYPVSRQSAFIRFNVESLNQLVLVFLFAFCQTRPFLRSNDLYDRMVFDEYKPKKTSKMEMNHLPHSKWSTELPLNSFSRRPVSISQFSHKPDFAFLTLPERERELEQESVSTLKLILN